MAKFNKIIRIITIAPLMALALLIILFVVDQNFFGSVLHFVLAICFLTLLPILAYPLQPFIPKFKDKGRDGQRNLAIVMAVVGYVCSIISAVLFSAPKTVWMIYLVYFISGLGILLFNKVLKIKASGHSCGIVGPICILVYSIGLKGLWGLVLMAIAGYSSLKMKRHTFSQLVWGGIIPVVALVVSVFITMPF